MTGLELWSCAGAPVAALLGSFAGMKVAIGQLERSRVDHERRLGVLEKATGLGGETGQFMTVAEAAARVEASEERWSTIQDQLKGLQRTIDAVALRVDAAIARNQGG